MEINSTFNNGQFIQLPAQEKKSNFKIAALAYIVFFAPLFTRAKNDGFVRYHMKQGLALFIACAVLQIFGYVSFMSWLFFWQMFIVVLFFLATGIYYSLIGVQKPLPIIGEWAEDLNF